MSGQYIKHLVMLLVMLMSPLVHAGIPTHISKAVNASNVIQNRIEMEIPKISQNGGLVPVRIKAVKLDKKDDHVDEVWFFDQERPEQIAHFKLSPVADATGLATFIKLRGTTVVYAVAKLSDGRVISGHSDVKITNGGCGGG